MIFNKRKVETGMKLHNFKSTKFLVSCFFSSVDLQYDIVVCRRFRLIFPRAAVRLLIFAEGLCVAVWPLLSRCAIWVRLLCTY